MSTIEKLFVQIFEQKNQIIEQVKLQDDLYSQHLASKLLIDGITPPPWLWNPNFDSESLDPKELRKEELISELLLPHPRPAVPYSGGQCSLYNKPAVIVDNGELSEGFMEIHASNKRINAVDRPMIVPEGHDNGIVSTLNCVPEFDLSAISPQGQIEVKISNIYSAPDQSLARIQRSKSRQKALELRKTTKTAVKSRLADENDTGVSSSGIKLSRIGSQQLDHDNQLLELAKYSDTISDNCAVRRAIGEFLSKEKDVNTYRGRITRSRNSCNLSSHESKSLKLDNSSNIAKEDSGRMINSQSTCIEGISKPVHLSNTTSQRVTRSKFGALKLDNSSNIAQEDSGRMIRSQSTWIEGISKPVHFTSQRVTRSKSGGSKKSPLANSLNGVEGFHLQNVSGGEVIPHCPQSNAIVNHEGKADYVTETEPISDGPAQAACSEPNMDAAGLSVGLEVFVSRPPSDCSMFLKPKTLDFDDMEKCSLNEDSGRTISAQSTCIEGISKPVHLSNTTNQRVTQSKFGASKLDNSSNIAKEDSGRMIRSQSTCIEGISKPVHLSNTTSQRVTRSKSGASKKSPLANSLNEVEGFHLQNVSGGEVIPHCPQSNAIVNHEGKADYVTETELISDGPAQAACSEPNMDVAGLSVGLEVFVSRPPSDCSIFLKPKTLDFNDMEKCSLNEIYSPMLGKERLDKSSEKRCNSEKPTASTFDNPSRKSLERQALKQEVSNKTTEAWWSSFETCAECVEVDEEVPISKTNKNLKNVEDNSEAVQEIEESPVSHGPDVALSIARKDLDVEIHQKVKCHLMEGFGSSPKLQVEERKLGYNGSDRSEATPFSFKRQQLGPSFVSSLTKHSTVDQRCLVGEVGVTDPSSSVLDVRQCHVEDNQDLMCFGNILDKAKKNGLACNESTLLKKKSYVREDGFLSCGSVGSLHCEDKNSSSFDKGELQLLEKSLIPGRILMSATETSWPRFKRRKIEGRQTNFVSASLSFRVKDSLSIGGHTSNRYLKSAGDNLGTALQFQCSPVSHEGDVAQSNVAKSPDVEMHQKVKYCLTQGIEPSLELQLKQDELGFEERNQSTNTPSTFKHGQLGPSVVSSLTKEAPGDSQGCSIENVETADTTSIVLDERMQGDEQKYKNLLHSENNIAMDNKDDLTHAERMLQEANPHFKEDGLFSCSSVASPQDNHLGSIVADQTMPEFERFIIDAEENRQPHIVGDAFSFDKLDLPSNTIERASVLEELCKSASMYTPLSQFSTTFKLHRTPDLYQSVPNGVLEHMNPRSTLNLDDDSGKQLRASSSWVDEGKCAFQGLSYTDCVQYSDGYFGWSLKNPPMSPVGKLWDRISSHFSSSEKRQSSNAELTCFPIEEDPSISEENESSDEVVDTIQEDICSTLLNCGAKREPLAEIAEACVNPPTSVSAAETFPDRSSLDSVNTEVSFTGKQKLGNRHSGTRCTNEAKENRTLSVSTNCIKKATESLKNRFSKPKLSRKTSLRKGGLSFSKRESKHNNIVSNITSFVPLVQQKKQAAAIGTGKRDIKVKALDAAEAAKRLEEKKENERKMRKEALKLERARIEQENLLKMELKMKKKEEEQKKKAADMAARKRLREEEEKKEKERKRKRIEEPRRQQREQEGKLRFGKVVKEDQKANSSMGSNDEFRKHQKIEKEKGDDNIVKKPQTESRVTEILTSEAKQAVLKDCEAFNHCGDTGEPTSVLTKTTENDDLVAKTSVEKSYEISPYQCSDDDDDEEDEIPTRKFIPQWASKNSVALVLSSQEQVDPDTIFPPGSFCSVDEVLRPRKLQLK